jgi:hypothetical protein
MKYLTVEDLEKFNELERLEKNMHDLQKKWINEARKLQENNQPIDDTRPLFNEYLKASEEWKAYFEEIRTSILPQIIP